MKRIAIYGAGGFGSEVKRMLQSEAYQYSFAGYFDDFKQKIPILRRQDFDDILFAIADPKVRRKLVAGWNYPDVAFQPFISRDVRLNSTIDIGQGCILCPGIQLTVDISIGRFSIINLITTIGHNVSIGDFASIMPSVNISGNVTIGANSFIGTGASVLQGLTIGENCVVGAGTLVNTNIPANSTVVGVPGRVIKTEQFK